MEHKPDTDSTIDIPDRTSQVLSFIFRSSAEGQFALAKLRGASIFLPSAEGLPVTRETLDPITKELHPELVKPYQKWLHAMGYEECTN